MSSLFSLIESIMGFKTPKEDSPKTYDEQKIKFANDAAEISSQIALIMDRRDNKACHAALCLLLAVMIVKSVEPEHEEKCIDMLRDYILQVRNKNF